MTIFTERLRQCLQRFGVAQGGNVMLTFALVLVPIIGLIGAAVDYSRGSSAKVAIQAAADSTALMLSREAPGLTEEQRNQRANDYFQALFNRPEVTNLAVTPVFTTPQQGNFKLELTATATVPTMFMRVFGQNSMSVDVHSEVLWGIKKLELALALDNTGSMSSSGKMSNLKTAAKTLLTTLKNAAKTEGDVKVAIIPFDTTVRIGTTYKDNEWFDIDSAIDCNGWLPGTGCTPAIGRTTGRAACATARIRSTRRTTRRRRRCQDAVPGLDCGSLGRRCPSPPTGPRSTAKSTR